MSSAVADSGTVQALTSLAMAPKQRLFFLTTPDLKMPLREYAARARARA